MGPNLNEFEWLKNELNHNSLQVEKNQVVQEIPHDFEGIPVNENGYLSTIDKSNAAIRSGSVKYIPLNEAAYNLDIQPADISGVQLSIEELKNPERFWSQHTIYDKKQGVHRPAKKEDYLELAAHLPEVYKALESGTSLDDLLQDPALGDTVRQYFLDTNMVRASRGDGIVEMHGGGRHRVLAARELGEKMPVKVTNELQCQPKLAQDISIPECENNIYISADWDEHGLFW